MKVGLIKAGLYPCYSFYHNFTQEVLDVPVEKIKEWKKAQAAWNKMQDEISKLLMRK